MNKKVVLLTLAVATLTGCSGLGSMNQDLVVGGNREGINALMQGLVGLTKTAKEAPDAPNQFLNFRNVEEKEITKRKISPSFLDKLFAPSAPAQEEVGS